MGASALVEPVTLMPPKRKPPKARFATSVYPPRGVGPALGGLSSSALTRAVRIAAQVLGDAGLRAGDIFSQQEWEVLYASLKDWDEQPENADPGPVLAAAVSRAHSRLGVASGLGEKKLLSLLEKLRKLPYLESWAALIAVDWRKVHQDSVQEGDAWWSLPYRGKADPPPDEGA